MKALWQIFRLEIVSVWRSGTFAILTAVSAAWMLVFPYVVKGDGTAEGVREMYVRYSLGGVFALLVVALLATATGVLAKERAAKRLQLTMVRPVRYCAIAFGKIAALTLAGAAVLAVASGLLLVRVDATPRCSHVLSPTLPTPQEEARLMYEDYMKDPQTPENVRKARKSVVLRLLTQRALDHYQTIPTNEVVSWKFEGLGDLGGLAVRMRFTNQFEMRQDVVGLFRLDGLTGVVSNITQAVLTVPLEGEASGAGPGSCELKFANRGKNALMLRPRKDISILVPADSFVANLLRAYLVMVAVLAFVIAGGTFLSASLGRPVALFVAIVMLALSEMSPSVIEQYPDALETSRLDRLGLAMTRAVAAVTRPVSALSPLEALSKDECVETNDVIRSLLVNLAITPLFLALLTAFVMPRKQDDLG